MSRCLRPVVHSLYSERLIALVAILPAARGRALAVFRVANVVVLFVLPITIIFLVTTLVVTILRIVGIIVALVTIFVVTFFEILAVTVAMVIVFLIGPNLLFFLMCIGLNNKLRNCLFWIFKFKCSQNRFDEL